MPITDTAIQLQYQGFLNTQVLWKSDSVFGLKQIELPLQKLTEYESETSPSLILGKLIEQFVFYELNQFGSTTILAKNIQINKDKITLGEIDCLLKYVEKLIHLEIIYKFYLYDETVGNTELDRWIGPNRNDSLVQKLTKLKTKQLPLLHQPHTKTTLKALGLDVDKFKQCVYFKAQLFVPLDKINSTFSKINTTCITGFYIRLNQLEQYHNCSFYMPSKLEWLFDVKTDVDWLPYQNFVDSVTPVLNQQRSPLCWIKHNNNKVQKFFIVWWP